MSRLWGLLPVMGILVALSIPPARAQKSPAAMTHAQLSEALKEHLRSAYPNIQVSVAVWEEDPTRTAIYFIDESFSDLYGWQRFHYLMHNLPDDFVEDHLSESIWFELAPGERPEDLEYVDEDIISSIAPDVMGVLEDLGFFLALDDAMAPKDRTEEAEPCHGDFRITKRILAAMGLQEIEGVDMVSDACHVLMFKGAYCDCEVLFNVYQGSRLAAGARRKLSEEVRDPKE